MSNAPTLDDADQGFPSRPIGVPPSIGVHRLSFRSRPGEFASVVEAPGRGKSAFHNLVAALDQPSECKVSLQSEEVCGPSASAGFILQKDPLLPGYTALRHVKIGLEARDISRAERRERALREHKRGRLLGFSDRYTDQISNGQRQRVALARICAIDANVVLLDELLSALEAQDGAIALLAIIVIAEYWTVTVIETRLPRHIARAINVSTRVRL